MDELTRINDDHYLVKQLRNQTIGEYMDFTEGLMSFASVMGHEDAMDDVLKVEEEVASAVVDMLYERCNDIVTFSIALRCIAVDLMLSAEATVDNAALQQEIEEIEEGTCE